MSNKQTCPKCSGLIYITADSGEAPTVKCALCGLYHRKGGSPESLKKQLLGDKYKNPLALRSAEEISV